MQPAAPAWLCLACLLGFPPAFGDDLVTARMTVSAQVVPHVRLESLDAELPVTVTPADVVRGYLDVDRHFTLRTNALEQVVLQLHPRVGLAHAIDVAGLGAPLRVMDTTREVVAGASRLDLSFRVWLVGDTVPGTYAMPVHLAATIL